MWATMVGEGAMAFTRAKKKEPLGERELFEYAVGALSRRMRTVRDLRRLMKARAQEGEVGSGPWMRWWLG